MDCFAALAMTVGKGVLRRGIAGLFPLVNDRRALRACCRFPCPAPNAQSGGLIMSYSGSGGAWRSDSGVPPHAFDPWTQPELFRDVLTRRVFAFLIDLVVISVPVILGYLFIAVFGLITLGLGWALFWLASPASIVLAIAYYGSSLGGPHSATIGMSVMGLELPTWHCPPCYFVLGRTHAVRFYLSN